MQTRSQTKIKTLEQDFFIDFDEASRAWTANKKKCGNGCYQYICSAITKNGEPCKNKCLPIVGCLFCRIHNTHFNH